MNTVIDIGRHGAEQLQTATPTAIQRDQAARNIIGLLRRLPQTTVQADTADGVKRNVGVRVAPLNSPEIFSLAHRLAAYEPMVYAKVSGRAAVLGMMSANYSPDGTARQSSLRVLPLKRAYPLTSRKLPDASMATMLSGAVSAERAGVGSDRQPGSDLEHQATILGAISLHNPSIALGHRNHQVRGNGNSIASGLTNGQLGNLYAPGQAVSDFPGFGDPISINSQTVGKQDLLMIPDSFLDNDEAWGGMYQDASRIMLGAGLRALHAAQGASVNGQFQRLSERLG